ncbi:hypothetical protein B8V81_4861 [Paenibacillus pasadenensis]|uniref:Uncharacterized protein n=1 Tax=Paenibacillus pasadenensis TaxID=217090 RepID=A0A2N5N801_9BACL|nr:hypothetical protein B8V81_4861 [Paenibacillus pasadenensis]
MRGRSFPGLGRNRQKDLRKAGRHRRAGGTFRRSFIPYGVRGLWRRAGLARFGRRGPHRRGRFPDP